MTDSKLKKPKVRLQGIDGNAFVIMGTVTRALRRAGYSQEDIERYRKEAMSGDYDNLLQVTMNWIDMSTDDDDENEFEDEE